LSSIASGRSLEIDDQLRKERHFSDQFTNVAAATVLQRQVLANLARSGNQIFAIVSRKLDQIITRELITALLIVSKRICQIHKFMRAHKKSYEAGKKFRST
jgi:hypothetical protein